MADVNVLLTCAGQRVDIVQAFRDALAEGPHHGRVLVSDLDPLSPALFHADGVVVLPPVDDPGYGAAVAEACRREGVRAVLPLTDLDPVVLARLQEDAQVYKNFMNFPELYRRIRIDNIQGQYLPV